MVIGGSNITATKARISLMACLLRFGVPPAAADPLAPTASEREATARAVAAYETVFDSH